MKAVAVITGTVLQELGLLCGLGEGMSGQWRLILVHLTSSLLPFSLLPFSDQASGDLQGRETLWAPAVGTIDLAACLGSWTTVSWE